jgi:cytochrome c oxidase subunit 2
LNLIHSTLTLLAARWLADGGRLTFMPPEGSSGAARVDSLFWGLTGICGVFLVGICAAALIFLIRYRAGAKRSSGQEVRSTPIEITWLAVMGVLSLVMFAWGADVFYDIERPPADVRTIQVVGKQWMWKIQHPDGRREVNELHVPVGEPVRLLLHSQDVIHSFYVPAFRLKQDALPDRFTSFWFKPTRVGTYPLFCAEYCGTDHSLMRGTVFVMDQRDYATWMEGKDEGRSGLKSEGAQSALEGLPHEGADTFASGLPHAPGAELFQRMGCAGCHVFNQLVVAPRLDGLFGHNVRLTSDQTVVADENYIRESILWPNAKIVAGYVSPSLMPTYAGQVSDEQIDELIEFIKYVREGWNGPVSATQPGSQPAESPKP